MWKTSMRDMRACPIRRRLKWNLHRRLACDDTHILYKNVAIASTVSLSSKAPLFGTPSALSIMWQKEQVLAAEDKSLRQEFLQTLQLLGVERRALLVSFI